MPNGDLFGTMVPSKNPESKFEYSWISVKESLGIARELAAGITSLGLIETVKHDGREWKFLGLQAKNCKEWFLMHIANMFAGATTIAIFDILSEEAIAYIINHTQLQTVGMSKNLIEKNC
jgi:long-subunit acyl-CoA synthetase (AMP-forming)